jgi:hypothetical protein
MRSITQVGLKAAVSCGPHQLLLCGTFRPFGARAQMAAFGSWSKKMRLAIDLHKDLVQLPLPVV